ncbi:MAG: aminotransferase class IV [Deltaproteobacteria bacterium]|jgi:4-amino-4-deoxychorismate lyase|nr:aminotransferase class IV [Deltaproteobacteria bacterium]
MTEQLFLESIKAKGGLLHNLDLHQERVDRVFNHFFGQKAGFNLASLLPKPPDLNLYKVRLVYGLKPVDIQIIPYEIPKIDRVFLVKADEINYDFKFLDRQPINNLKKLAQANEANKDNKPIEVIIIRNGLLTDSSIANLVLENQSGLFTPQTPLLAGVKREYLLRKKIIVPAKISVGDIMLFGKIRFINAMIDLTDDVFIKTKDLDFGAFGHS